MIDESLTESAVYYLRDSAPQIGRARGHMVAKDGNLRRVKSLQMISETGGSLGDREARAYASEAYGKALEDLENATAEYETLRARREAAVYTIEAWRSQSSARKQGINL